MPIWFHTAAIPGGISYATTSNRRTFFAGWLTAFESTEERVQTLVRDSYTWANAFVRVIVNTKTGVTTVVSRINSISGNQSVAIAAATTGDFSDVVNTDALVTGNLINWNISGGTANSLTTTMFGSSLETVSNTTPILQLSGGFNFSGTGTEFAAVGGRISHDAVEANAELKLRSDAIFSNMRLFLRTNTKDAACSYTFRIDGVDGNQTITITAATSGAFEDAVNTDVVNAASEVNYEFTINGTGDIDLRSVCIKQNGNARDCIVAHAAAATYLQWDDILYSCPEGSTDENRWSATETDTLRDVLCTITLENAVIHVSICTLDGTFTLQSRVNGGDGNVSIAVGAGLTGVFEDTVNSEDLNAGDDWNWKLSTAGTSGGIAITVMSIEETQTAADDALMPYNVARVAMIVTA